ncbi:chromogranin-A-like isoform X1 [Takifugu flavidus]|uniref:chromogranin-A-like isoform X1 n=1 Tax=Takifugu flavidus TaxID=433684 RepID=UPI00254451CC|nr:chromogranin-A-like isoform X1 [Takifugu flavidus]
MNLQQELMQIQKEKEKLYSEMLGLLQENSTLQTKVAEQNSMQQSTKTQHEFEKTQLLKKLNNLQSSTSKLQEQNQRLQQKTKRLEEQKAGWLQDKRLQQENEKSRKHQTTMTEQEQIIPAGSTKDTEEHNETQHEAISCSNGDSSSQRRADGTFTPKSPSSQPEVLQRRSGDLQCPCVLMHRSTAGLPDKVASEAGSDHGNRKTEDEEQEEKEEGEEQKEDEEEDEEKGTELMDISHSSVVESSSERSPKETEPSSAPTKATSLESSTSENSDDRMTQVKEQPEKRQNGEPDRPRATTAVSTVGPEESLESAESEVDSLTLQWCEKLQQTFQLMKDQRPIIQKCLTERLNKLGMKPDQAGLKEDEYKSILLKMHTDLEKSKVMNPYYRKIQAKLCNRVEKRTLMKMPPGVVFSRRKGVRSECIEDERAHGVKEVKQAESQACKEWRNQIISKELMVKMDARVFNINIVILALCLQRFTRDLILKFSPVSKTIQSVPFRMAVFPCVLSRT